MGASALVVVRVVDGFAQGRLELPEPRLRLLVFLRETWALRGFALIRAETLVVVVDAKDVFTLQYEYVISQLRHGYRMVGHRSVAVVTKSEWSEYILKAF